MTCHNGRFCGRCRFCPPASAVVRRYRARRLSGTIRVLSFQAVVFSMEINPYLNRIKDLTERGNSLRGYL